MEIGGEKERGEEGREKETSLNTGPILDPAELSRQLLLYIQEMPAREEEFVRFHRIVSRLSRLLSKSYGKTIIRTITAAGTTFRIIVAIDMSH